MTTIPMQADFTTGEVAKLFGVTHRRVQYWYDNGMVSGSIDEFGYRSISRESLVAFLASSDRQLIEAVQPDIDNTPFAIKCRTVLHVWRGGKLLKFEGTSPSRISRKLIELREPLGAAFRINPPSGVSEILERGPLDSSGLKSILAITKAAGVRPFKLATAIGFKQKNLQKNLWYCLNAKRPVSLAIEMGVRRAFGLAPVKGGGA